MSDVCATPGCGHRFSFHHEHADGNSWPCGPGCRCLDFTTPDEPEVGAVASPGNEGTGGPNKARGEARSHAITHSESRRGMSRDAVQASFASQGAVISAYEEQMRRAGYVWTLARADREEPTP